jgi:hypothetical protein
MDFAVGYKNSLGNRSNSPVQIILCHSETLLTGEPGSIVSVGASPGRETLTP